jgi:hypothetical protein
VAGETIVFGNLDKEKPTSFARKRWGFYEEETVLKSRLVSGTAAANTVAAAVQDDREALVVGSDIFRNA